MQRFLKLDKKEVSELFKGKTITITGGTGSFGNFIVRELLKLDIKEITIFSRDEEKQLEMKNEIPDPRLNFEIGNIRDYDRLVECIKTDYLYHAAALKIITTSEKFPLEGIKTNLLGTNNVKQACLKNNVKKALLISTDKAVKPVNTYGMTKGLAEKVWLSKPFADPCSFNAVRYGNVIGSRGSVVPFFKKLIKERKPLPLTHKSMSRFLITLQQAIDLAFYATKMSTGGQVIIPKNPACKMIDLIVALAGEGYPWNLVGIRPGEKIAETLISEEELRRMEDKGEYVIVHPQGHWISVDNTQEEFTSETTVQLNPKEIKKLLDESVL